MGKPWKLDDTLRIRIEMMGAGSPTRRRERAEQAIADVARRRANVAEQLKTQRLNGHEAARIALDTDALEAAAKRTLAELNADGQR